MKVSAFAEPMCAGDQLAFSPELHSLSGLRPAGTVDHTEFEVSSPACASCNFSMIDSSSCSFFCKVALKS